MFTSSQFNDSISLAVAEYVELRQLNVRRDVDGFLTAQPKVNNFTHGESN